VNVSHPKGELDLGRICWEVSKGEMIDIPRLKTVVRARNREGHSVSLWGVETPTLL